MLYSVGINAALLVLALLQAIALVLQSSLFSFILIALFDLKSTQKPDKYIKIQNIEPNNKTQINNLLSDKASRGPRVLITGKSASNSNTNLTVRILL